MSRLLLAFLAFWALVPGADARVIKGFVVEAQRATPEVGASVDANTTLGIEAGGHIVIMTDTARMIRGDGPYEGTAGSLFEAVATGGEAGEPLAESILLGLLSLAKEPDKSVETVFSTRGSIGSLAMAPYAIGPGMSVFCIHENVLPAFFTPHPPISDTRLIVNRITHPKELLMLDWPAGAGWIGWPTHWPPPATGRYIVAIGEGGAWKVRFELVGSRPETALRQAALYYEAGCRPQAAVAMRAAVAGAEHR